MLPHLFLEANMSTYNQAVALRDKILRGDIVIGILPAESFDEMVALFTEAGEAGSADAWFELGQALAGGLNTFEPDPWAAVSAFENAWDAGHQEAGLALARQAYFRRMDDEDFSIAKVLEIMDALLSDDESGEATVLAGWMHFAGYGFDQDMAKGAALQARAAEAGNANAMFELFVLYTNGQGVEPNLAEGRVWLERAAHAGSARAMYNMGALHGVGEGFEQNDEKAFQWYKKAAAEGHARGAGAVSVMYAAGEGTPRDDAQAEAYYNLALELGYDAWELYDSMEIEMPFEA